MLFPSCPGHREGASSCVVHSFHGNRTGLECWTLGTQGTLTATSGTPRGPFSTRPSLFSRSTISAAILSSHVPLPMICGGSRVKACKVLCHEWFIKNDEDSFGQTSIRLLSPLSG